MWYGWVTVPGAVGYTRVVLKSHGFRDVGRKVREFIEANPLPPCRQ
jgi:hypothetical protein